MPDNMLEKTYEPQSVESKIYAFWEQHNLFRPEVQPETAAPFSIVIPPPNVTGTLHIGHALDDTLQDILIRWKRMAGFRSLWMPGMDHAGIATQNVVERNLRETQGKSKFDLGREAFTQTVWDWATARRGDIWNQFRRLGISPDFSRERFTLDEGCSKAVREAFVTLYQRGLIYRGTYIVNWCPRCTSAISDIETEYVEEDSHLWQIKYSLTDGSTYLTVATTRPETMFADVAVAVHPEDERYKTLIGKTVTLPLSNRDIPIIADEYVDREFGTGALKITPAHDPNDFQLSLKHKLDPIWVIDELGQLKVEDFVPESIRGLERFAARKETERLLEAGGFLLGKEAHHHSVGKCQRCSTTIEPLLSKQWFVKSEPIAKKCIASLEAGNLQFIPDRWTKIYLDWMHNIRDWCISRQLWWGHQIPAWYCDDCGEITVAQDTPAACSHCSKTALTQETDVLDTWFSSGLWPFSTMGWPDQDASDFKTYYPTSVLVTGFDIIFFWVARMTMFGEELTGQSPFHTVFIHGLVRDEKGQKMSKSKGNTIDPVEVIDQYGCDALRYSLTSLVTGGQDIKLSKDSFDQGKLFANKLWNASRFVLMNLEGSDANAIDYDALTAMDRWILGHLRRTIETVTAKLEAYRFSDVTDVLYDFIWNTFCDWYVEYAKKQLRDETTKANTQRILHLVLDDTLRLLHPVMPHITEEIWQKLPHKQGVSISVAAFPTTDMLSALGPTDEASINFVLETVRAVRNVRQTSGVTPSQPTAVFIESPNAAEYAALQHNQDVLMHFVKITELILTPKLDEQPPQTAVGVVGASRVLVSLAGTIDIEGEIARQLKKRETLQKEWEQLTQLVGNPNFVDRAPAAVVEKNRVRIQELDQQLKLIDEQLATLQPT